MGEKGDKGDNGEKGMTGDKVSNLAKESQVLCIMKHLITDVTLFTFLPIPHAG